MVSIITSNITNCDLKEVVNKLLPDSIAKDIEKACQGIYPLHDVYIRKVKKKVTDLNLYKNICTYKMMRHSARFDTNMKITICSLNDAIFNILNKNNLFSSIFFFPL